MRILIAEDDHASRVLLQRFFSDYGDCDMAIDGIEALDAIILAHEDQEPYGLVCLDIMMPQMDGQTALKIIRDHERMMGMHGTDGVKIIMTTALDDFDNIKNAFTEQCEAYLVKPIEKEKVSQTLDKLGFNRLAHVQG